jgi:hypothetical protein
VPLLKPYQSTDNSTNAAAARPIKSRLQRRHSRLRCN